MDWLDDWMDDDPELFEWIRDGEVDAAVADDQDERHDCGAGPEGCFRPLDQPCCRDGDGDG